MLSGVKIIPRDQVVQKDHIPPPKEKKKVGRRKRKHNRKRQSPCYSSSLDDGEGSYSVKERGKKGRKWYSSEEHSSSYSSGSESDRGDVLTDSSRRTRKNKARSRKRGGSSSDVSIESSSSHGKHVNGRYNVKKSIVDMECARREAGLEWMVKPGEKSKGQDSLPIESVAEEHLLPEEKKNNPKEMNPYLKDGRTGYPDELKMGTGELLRSSVVGDGGASWRLKAMKRAREHASREGRKFEEVVEERWGSFGHFAESVASRGAAPSHAHLFAIRSRKSNVGRDCEADDKGMVEKDVNKDVGEDFMRRPSRRHPEMRAPKIHGSLTWGSHKEGKMPRIDPGSVPLMKSGLNKFADDGSYMIEFMRRESVRSDRTVPSQTSSDLRAEEDEGILVKRDENRDEKMVELAPGDNQLAAMVLKLRMKGMHEEADKFEKKSKNVKACQFSASPSSVPRGGGGRAPNEVASAARRREDDADSKLAERIVNNRRFSISGQADDEFDYDPAPIRKRRKSRPHHDPENPSAPRRLSTQQERCVFCFENPQRPRHLVISVGNFAYMMLPMLRPIVPGHCCIVPVQHEAGTRNVEEDVWEEVRNFKKCLVMMFGRQEKEPVFLETVVDLQQQRRHCLVECVPLPLDVSRQAPVYFKKAIEEAESEWSQHHRKRLIETGEKGLRGSIPKGFPYFHVEFGLGRGFVHVIEDEGAFRAGFGLNVIRGILGMPAEDMHRRRRADPEDVQRRAAAAFLLHWSEFDWTRHLLA